MQLGGGFYNRLAADRQRLVRSQATLRVFNRGETLFLQGDLPSDVFVIVTGHVKLTVITQGGREVLINVCGPGDWVEARAAVSKSPQSASAIGLTSPTEVLSLNRRAFDELVRFDAAFNSAVIEELAEDLRVASFRQLELSVDDVRGRVARRLLELVDRFGKADELSGTASLKSPITQQELADWIGVSRQAVVKELRRLRTAGVIETKGSRFTILQVDELEKRAVSLESLS